MSKITITPGATTLADWRAIYEGASAAPSIDEAPLDLFFRPGVKLDFSNKPAGHVVNSPDETVRWLDHVRRSLRGV